MIDVSANGCVLTFGGDGISSVSFGDLSDTGTPISFEEIAPIGIERDLNNEISIRRQIVSPAFSIGVIPGSESDRKMRALLLSLQVSGNGVSSAYEVRIPTATLTFPQGGAMAGEVLTFSEGYLVGGSSAIDITSDGRFTGKPYRFVFKSISSNRSTYGAGGRDMYSQTMLCRNNKVISGLYYSRVSSSGSARMIAHPIETGAMVFDQKYVEPGKVSLATKVPLALLEDIEEEFGKMLADRSLGRSYGRKSETPYSVITKSSVYKNLSLLSFRHDETPDSFDLFEYSLEFQELMFSNAKGMNTTTDPDDFDSPPSAAKSIQSSRPSA